MCCTVAPEFHDVRAAGAPWEQFPLLHAVVLTIHGGVLVRKHDGPIRQGGTSATNLEQDSARLAASETGKHHVGGNVMVDWPLQKDSCGCHASGAASSVTGEREMNLRIPYPRVPVRCPCAH